MYQFTSDYTEGCAPEILAAMTACNLEQNSGYYTDAHCARAAELIKDACGAPQASVHFFIGGTNANANIILNLLRRPYQGIFAAETSHIATHEAGAIERTGHKVLLLHGCGGKLSAEQVESAWQKYWLDPSREHIVEPKAVYISQPTEIGTLYSKTELKALYAVCRQHELYLFVDGARLGYALAAPENDVSLPELSELCDVFCIGGTKCGAWLGEACVLLRPELERGFFSLRKQGGSILAKGHLIGLQFEILMSKISSANNTSGELLYTHICRQGINTALRIRQALVENGIKLFIDSPTNQQFAVFTENQLKTLSENFLLARWETLTDGLVVVRICTSWATRDDETEKLLCALKAL